MRWGGEGVGDVGVWACLLAGGRRFVLNGLWMEGGEVVGSTAYCIRNSAAIENEVFVSGQDVQICK